MTPKPTASPRRRRARPGAIPLDLDLPRFCGQLEAWAEQQGLGPLIGLDEAGRGPLAGPVVAAACALPSPCPIAGLDDSKKLTAAARDGLYEAIIAESRAWSVAVVEPAVIDEINILQASLRAMAAAWREVVASSPALAEAVVLVDGNQRAPLPADVDQRTAVKGDSRSTHIAAASILAKVTRDRLMVAYDARWPEYGFAQHKGYPTAAHLAALAEHGPCPIHRRSFRLGPRAPA